MNHLSEENKKMKIKRTKAYNSRIKEIKDNYKANNTFNFDININDNDREDIDNKNENNDTNININTSTTAKRVKKKVKVVKKKQIKPEENFF